MKITKEQSHVIVKNHFENMGYKVMPLKNVNTNGADIKIINEYNVYLVEVKLAQKTTRSWRVTPVEKNRINDDYVAIVMPNSYVHIDTMKDHLKNSAKDRSRRITKLVNLYSRKR